MPYHVAVLIDGGHWAETFGDRDREAVDVEVQCWREDYCFHRGRATIKRRAFDRVPSQRQLAAWVWEQS